MVTVQIPDRSPQVQKSPTIRVVSGDPVELDHSLETVKAFPARPRSPEKGPAGQPRPEVVSGLLPVLLDGPGHPQIARLTALAIQPGQDMDDGHVHLVGPSLEDPAASVKVEIAHQVGGAQNGGVGLLIAGLLVPYHQGQHPMVVAPQVPMAEKALALWERAEVAILGLDRNELADDPSDRRLQVRVVGRPPALDSRYQVLPYELAGEVNHARVGVRPMRRGRVSHPRVLPPQHLHHPGIGLRRDQQPMTEVCLQARPNGAPEGELCSWRRAADKPCHRVLLGKQWREGGGQQRQCSESRTHRHPGTCWAHRGLSLGVSSNHAHNSRSPRTRPVATGRDHEVAEQSPGTSRLPSAMGPL